MCCAAAPAEVGVVLRWGLCVENNKECVPRWGLRVVSSREYVLTVMCDCCCCPPAG
jgi:hypothetical protein